MKVSQIYTCTESTRSKTVLILSQHRNIGKILGRMFLAHAEPSRSENALTLSGREEGLW
jgi:hypothetical protein